jgi:hypothetical protein
LTPGSIYRLELDGYDPRGVLVPYLPALRSLTVRDVPDGEDWLEELLTISPEEERSSASTSKTQHKNVDDKEDTEYKGKPRFPSLRHLSLPSTSLFGFPELDYTTLTHLDLSSNLLNTIPSSLASLTSLESVNLSSNMIESVRGVENVLPNLRAINLRNNRIDCLSGLDRLVYLERVDVRKNELYESDEVGRLAQCQNLKEVWVGAGNHFLEREEEWRVNVFRAFAEEGKEKALLDGYEMTWAEKRTVQAELQKMGKRAGGRSPGQERSSRTTDLPLNSAMPDSKTPAATLRKDPLSGSGMKTMRVQHAHVGKIAEVESGRSTPISKRKRQRIVDLDGTVRMASESDDGETTRALQGLRFAGGSGGTTRSNGNEPIAGGQLTNEPDQGSLLEAIGMSEAEIKQPPTTSSHSRSRTTHHDDELPATLAGKPEKKSRRARASASVYEPSAGVDRSSDLSPDELRARMEALKTEVGDSWLKVLAGQQLQASTRVPDPLPRKIEEERPTSSAQTAVASAQEDQGQNVVQVMKRSKAKKKAIGEIK